MMLNGRRRLCVTSADGRSGERERHDALSTLTAKRPHPTRLETRTKESNMCASLRVTETHGRNESKCALCAEV